MGTLRLHKIYLFSYDFDGWLQLYRHALTCHRDNDEHLEDSFLCRHIADLLLCGVILNTASASSAAQLLVISNIDSSMQWPQIQTSVRLRVGICSASGKYSYLVKGVARVPLNLWTADNEADAVFSNGIMPRYY